jgi:hypothetical protein
LKGDQESLRQPNFLSRKWLNLSMMRHPESQDLAFGSDLISKMWAFDGNNLGKISQSKE